MTVAILVCRSLVAVVLIAAGAAKLADIHGFRATLEGLRLPFARRRGLAEVIASLELGVGVVSLTSAWPVVTDTAVVVLTLAFAVAAGMAIRTAPGLKCRCFGAVANTQFGRATLVRSLVLATISMTVLVASMNVGERFEWGIPQLTMLLSSALIFAWVTAEAARAVELTHGEGVT